MFLIVHCFLLLSFQNYDLLIDFDVFLWFLNDFCCFWTFLGPKGLGRALGPWAHGPWAHGPWAQGNLLYLWTPNFLYLWTPNFQHLPTPNFQHLSTPSPQHLSTPNFLHLSAPNFLHLSSPNFLHLRAPIQIKSGGVVWGI